MPVVTDFPFTLDPAPVLKRYGREVSALLARAGSSASAAARSWHSHALRAGLARISSKDGKLTATARATSRD